MLNGVRVLEVSRPQTMLAGRVLADLGADVVVVEPPGGAPGRRLPPFLGERAGLERGLAWHALNRNKRGVTIDVDCTDGRDAFLRLAAGAQVVIEGEQPRFESLTERGVVHCAVRAFSANGPKRDIAYTDRTVVAAAGPPYYTGDGDRGPLHLPVPQAMMEAGAEAAVAVLAGLAARERDGAGQRAGVSMRVAAMMSAFSAPYYRGTKEAKPQRTSARRPVVGIRAPQFYACRDGFVQVNISTGGFGALTRRMTEWVATRVPLAADVVDTDWTRFPYGDDADAARRLQSTIDALTAAFAAMTKFEIGDAAREHGFFAAPLLDMSDVARFAQYRERGLWAKQTLPDGRAIDAPLRFAHFSDYTIEPGRPAPALSEHTHELLEEAGLSGAEIQALFAHGVI